MARPYYSFRTGRRPPTIDLNRAKRLFRATYDAFIDEGYLSKLIGYDCVDAGPVPGTAGTDVEAFVFRRTLRDNLWPVTERLPSWTEDEFMDMIEFIFDHVSKPVEPRYYHSYNGCGYHDSKFDSVAGRKRYRTEVNEFLLLLEGGWELSADGELLHRVDVSVSDLLDRKLPTSVPATVQARVDAAVRKFRLRTSNRDDRRDAVRDIADVLEFMRPQLKHVFTKPDDGLLFDMINNFGIRHFNDRQRTEYDAIWLSWMFHFLLATIHAGTRFLEEESQKVAGKDS